VLLAGASGCSSEAADPKVTPLTLLTAPTPGAFHEVGTAIANAFNRQLPGILAQSQLRPAAVPNVDAIQQGTAELALVAGGEAYLAYTTGSSYSTTKHGAGHKKLRAIASLFLTKLHVLVKRDSPVDSLADLRGKSMAIGMTGSPNENFRAVLLAAYGLKVGDVALIVEPGANIATGMREDRLDVVMAFSGTRPALVSETLSAVQVRLIPIEREKAATIQSGLPFLISTVIPAGTYTDQHDDVPTVGQDVLLICRDDLPEDLVYHLTRAIFQSVAELASANPAALGIDADRGSSAPIPLHPGASRYYRERELLR
jgi:TRAP transporter TAXI family solute receptor